MLWGRRNMRKKKFHRLKRFSPRDLIKASQLRPTNLEKKSQPLKSFVWLSCRTGNASLKSGREKTFQPAKVFSHTFRQLWPHSIWLRVRVAQCPMALHVMVQSHLGWPWECHKSPDTSLGTILDEYALQDGWHPSCYRLLRHTLLRMAGHDATHLAKHTHPEWRKRGHQGT